jgi:hypothetical protein
MILQILFTKIAKTPAKAAATLASGVKKKDSYMPCDSNGPLKTSSE